ncbi:hypothetical protein [Oceanobacillus sp. CFH 90083]|uniref:hypothetical protein n=1 Tax=Oceanobacillus sp. CFH 90083 TaxID=2592336 RepID=UPI00128BC7B8|nr:hypothetical protein [Oceanobacillus sp. CFH 90083]
MNNRNMMTSLLALGAAGVAAYGVTKGIQNGTFQKLPQTISNALNNQNVQQLTKPIQNMMGNQGGQQLTNAVQQGASKLQQMGNNNQSMQ